MNRRELELAAVQGVLAGEPAVQERAARLARLLGYDEQALLYFRRWHGPWLTRFARGFTAAGDARTWLVAGLALAATRRPKALHVALRLGAGSLLGAMAAQALKRTLNRRRPDNAIDGFTALSENPDAFSFPSGHSAAAFAVATALAGEPGHAGPLSLGLACGIALSRVYLGAHYPIDVLVGCVLGAAVGGLARVAVP